MKPDDRPVLKYDQAGRLSIQDGSVLLFRGRGFFSRAIQSVGRSPYSHAAIVGWWNHRLLVIEAREGKGVRVIPLSDVLASGADVELWDVRPHAFMKNDSLTPAFQEATRAHVVQAALAWLSAPYGVRTIARIYAGRLLSVLGFIGPVGRLSQRLARGVRDSRGRPTSGLICSQLVGLAWGDAGIDLVEDLPQWDEAVVEPGDLPKGGRLRLLGRLLP